MAADARPYKSKEQDGNGNEIILRDQQLVEQSSQTTMASTEYFEIVDVDGRMAKIPKDNMISVVREALGSLLNGLADQTTVAKFLTLNGNTLGASAAATAASVLGAAGPEIVANTDLNNLTTIGKYYCAGGIGSGVTPTLTHCPVADGGFMMEVTKCNTNSSEIFQILYSVTDNGLYKRYKIGTTWSSWVKFTSQTVS